MFEPLSEHERACLDALLVGKPAELGDEYEAKDGDAPPRKAWRPSTPAKTIRGAFLRALAFGLPIRRSSADQPFIVHLPGTGIVIRGACIEGVVDLSGAGADAQRGALQLDLAGCEFRGDPSDAVDEFGRARPVLKVENARLVRACLTDCAFTHVSFANAQIAGDFVVKHARAVNDECVLDMREARIDGAVRLRESTFILKARTRPNPEGRDAFAVDLYGAKVGGDIELTPRVVARGGVRMAGSQVAGDVWCYGLVASAMDRNTALEIQLARIKGALLIRAQTKPQDEKTVVQAVEIEGEVNLLSAEVGSWLLLEFSSFTAKPDTPEAARTDHTLIRLAMARIGGELHIEGKSRDSAEGAAAFPDFPGSVNLHGAQVAGDVVLKNYRHTANGFGVSLDYARIGRQAMIGSPGARMGPVLAREARVGVDLVLDGEIGNPAFYWAAVLASGVQIGGKLDVKDGCTLNGGLDIEFACIEQSLTLHPGAKLRPISGVALRAIQSRIGAVRLSGGFCGKLDFELARISGNFNIGQQDLPLTFLVRSQDDKPLLDPQLSLKDADIRGVLNVYAMQQGQEQRAATPDVFVHPKQPARGPARRPPDSARSEPLACYPGWRLVEFKRDAKADGFDLVLLGPNGDRLTLDGTSPPIHDFNARGLLKLDTDEQIRDYLRFFCGCVWGDLGAFRVIETRDMLSPYEMEEKASPDASPQPIRIVSKKPEGIELTATLQYGHALFTVEMFIYRTGMVEMKEDTPIATLLHTERVKHQSPWRLFKGKWAPPLFAGEWKDDNRSRDAEREAILSDRRERLKEYEGSKQRLEKTKLHQVDLSNATIGVLRDNNGLNWPDFVHLRLTDFRYQSIVARDDGPVQRATGEGDPVQRLNRLVSGATKTVKGGGGAESAETRLTYPASWSYEDYELANAICLERKNTGVASDLAKWLVKNAEYSAVRHRQGRLRWLRLSSQTRDLLDFEPQPFEQLIAVTRQGGHHDVVRKVVEFRAERESATYCARAKTPVEVTVAWLSRAAGYAYRTFFGQGLAPSKALATTFSFWVVGAIAATYFAWGDIWLPTQNTERHRGVLEMVAGVSPAQRKPALVLSDGRNAGAPCRGEISGAIYAVDALVPFIDLGEESRCHVRAGAWLSKWLKAFYSLLGALILSLTILTIANSARRYVDR